ncbi:DNA repair protein Rev1 [Aphis gossypii]|uniref:DNA repair protein Rev1 n=1 Tax=Aphis gossypii TaxID=80765 RepID=UPI002159AEB6|nr:DNA repair protein Rev1 [Aphis gossypii]
MKRNRKNTNGFEKWGGYMEAKKTKLEQQFTEKATDDSNHVKSQIFKGISIFVNGYTLPSANELKRIMMENGGVYHHYHRPNITTHIIASNLPTAKLKLLKQFKIVKPEWISDSLKDGKLLNYENYLLFIDKPNQPKIDFPVRAKNASEPTFLSEFYNNSRLHLISTMATTFKRLVNDTRKQNQTDYPGRQRLKNWIEQNRVKNMLFNDSELDNDKIIMHIDMDCFFVSAGLVERPELRGLPVAVTHAKGNLSKQREGVDRGTEFNLYVKRWRGDDDENDEEEEAHEIRPRSTKRDGINETDSMAEIACCSYEARKVGIKNGMLVGRALKMCPTLKLIPYNFEQYKKVAHTLYTHILNDYTLDVEAVSCDELYLDCSHILETTKASPIELAMFLRNEIKEKTQCPCSTGIGSNYLLARLATKKAKPDGQFYLEPGIVMDFMKNIDILDVPGVGRTLGHKLSTLGISTCGELSALSLQTLQSEFGNKTGLSLYKHCRGEDDRKLNYDYKPKSVSADVNYGIRFQNKEESDNFVRQLCNEVEKRLDDIEMNGKTVTLKLMIRNAEAPKESAKFLGHGFCDNITKSSSLTKSTSNSRIIFQVVNKIMNQLDIDPTELRGIGIQMNKLESRIVTGPGRIENFISNMKSEPKINHTLVNENTDNDKIILTKVSKPKSHQSSSTENINKSKSVMDFFKPKEDLNSKNQLKSSNSKSIVPCQSLVNIKMSQVDPSFLDALPADLRLELENELKSHENLNSTFIENQNSPIMEVTMTEESSKLYQHVQIDKMKEFIEEWVVTENEPKMCDNIMVSKYLCNLISDAKTEDAYEIIRKLYRLIKNKDDLAWKQSYFDILKNVQEIMMNLYNAKMKVETTFK